MSNLVSRDALARSVARLLGMQADPRPTTPTSGSFFCKDLVINYFYDYFSSSADSDNGERNTLSTSKLNRITDRLDMTLAVYHGYQSTNSTNKQTNLVSSAFI